jgi:dTDP-4-dehydrorhamnose reductase
VATATAALIGTGRYGLYHITNGGSCPWYEFARSIFELAGVQADLSPQTSKEYGAPARRPAFSVLGTKKYHALGLPEIRTWREALAAYLEERKKKR